MESNNPLRTMAQAPSQIRITDKSAVVDDIYRLDVVRFFLSKSIPTPDPRLYISGPTQQWKSLAKASQEGWISPPEQGGLQNTADTVLQYNMDRNQNINQLTFQLLNVPCNWSVWYLDANRGIFTMMTDVTGNVVSGTLTGNKIMGNKTSTNYLPFQFDTPTLNTSVVEIHLDRRISADQLPHYLGTALAAPYSLGVRNVNFNYAVNEIDNLPQDDIPTTINHPLGTMERILPRYSTGLLAIDSVVSTAWRSSPQPIARAIVPFYMDVRDAAGAAQLIDRLKINPLFPGPHMNIYYSTDETLSRFYVSHNRRYFTLNGAATFTANSGITATASGDSATMPNGATSGDNRAVEFDSKQHWTIGMDWTPTSAGTTDTTHRWLWSYNDGGSNSLGLVFVPASSVNGVSLTGTFQIRQGGDGGTILFTSASTTVNVNTKYIVVIGYVQDDQDIPRGWYFAKQSVSNQAALTVQTSTVNPPTNFLPTTIRLGSDPGTTLSMKGTASMFWIRQGRWYTPAVTAFLRNQESFIQGKGKVPNKPPIRTNGHYKGVLIARLLGNRAAWVGPGGHAWDDKVWKPIQQGYKLARGVYAIQPMHAKYIKLEFTHLVARPYHWPDHKQIHVYDYPRWVKRWYEKHKWNGDGGQAASSYTTNLLPDRFEALLPPPVPGQSVRLPQLQQYLYFGSNSTYGTPTIYSQTNGTAEMYDQNDQTDSLLLQQEIERSAGSMKFFREGRHDYEERTIHPKKKEAYFVGIREINAYRSDYTQLNDVAVYRETFIDDQHVASNTNFTRNSQIMMASATGAQIVSKQFSSWSKFTSVQMATFGSTWETIMGASSTTADPVMTLATYGHLLDPQANQFTGSPLTTASTKLTPVTGVYAPALQGNQLQADQNGTLEYGFRTTSFGLNLVSSFDAQWLDGVSHLIASGSTAPTVSYDGAASPPSPAGGTGKIVWNATGNFAVGAARIGTAQAFNVGDTRTWSAYIKADQNMTVHMLVTGGVGFTDQVINLTTGWNRYSITATNNASSTSVTLYFYQPSVTGTMWVTLFQVVEGSNMTDWQSPTVSGASRTSAMCRILVPQTNQTQTQGSYELRLYQSGSLISKRPFTPILGAWTETTTEAAPTTGVQDFSAAIVQVNTSVSESFVVDFLGLFQHPVRWEIQNDNSGNYQLVGLGQNDPRGFITLPAANTKLRVRVTALRSGIVVTGYVIIPWYIESPLVNRIPINYNPPWGQSDADRGSPSNMPEFQTWSRSFPQQYSIFPEKMAVTS